MDIIGDMTNLEPWYVKCNPKAYVPTMFVGVDNTPICESAQIMTYIDENFQGKCQLQKQVKENETFQLRYDELY